MQVVEELETWTDGVGLILRGAENEANTFCSGGDLNTVHKIKGPEMGFRMSVLMNEATERLQRLPLVSACLIQVKIKFKLCGKGGLSFFRCRDYQMSK